MTWVAWLMGLVGPLALRVLSALGMGMIAFTGVNELVQGLVSAAQSSWSSLPSAVLGLCSLAGMPQALGLIFGAFGARATLWLAANTAKLVFK